MFRKTTCGVDGALKLGTLPERMRATEKSTKPRSLGLSDDDRRGRRGRRGAVKSVLSIRPAHPSIGPPLAAAVRPSGSGSPLWWREIHPSPALSSRPLATLAPPCYLLLAVVATFECSFVVCCSCSVVFVCAKTRGFLGSPIANKQSA